MFPLMRAELLPGHQRSKLITGVVRANTEKAVCKKKLQSGPVTGESGKGLFWQEFRGKGFAGTNFPDRSACNPPARAIPIQVQAVYGAPLRGPVRSQRLLGRAYDMRNVAGAMRDSVNFMFVKAFFDH